MMSVSIIMPVYNVEKYLRESIESILAQTYTNYELILVDDGSPDGCPQICDEYAKQYEQIRVCHKQNGGLSSARNAGIKNACGKYILFVDSDDTIEPNLLEDVVSQAEKTNADVTIFGVNTKVIKSGVVQAYRKGKHAPALLEGRSQTEGNFIFLTEDNAWSFSTDKLYKREIIVENNIEYNSYYDKVCEDTIFLLDLFPFVNKICIVEGCYYNYAIRDTQSVVMSFVPNRYEKYYGRFCKTRALLSQMGQESDKQEFLYSLYCTFILWAYEMMFHKDCRYTLRERYKYIKNTFSIRQEGKDFCKNAREYIKNQEVYLQASKTARKVLDNILKGKYRKAWMYHVLAFMRR